MRRQRQPVTVRVPGRDEDDAVARLTTVAAQVRARRPRSPGDLRIRVRADGRVRAGRLSGTYTVFPKLRGRLEPRPTGGVQLTGTVTEHGAVLVLLAALGLGLLVSLVLLVVAVSRAAVSGIVVTGGGALLFALVVWGLHWTRRDFRMDVDEFVRAFDHALGRKG